MLKAGKVFLKLLRLEDIDYACNMLKEESAELISDNYGADINIEENKEGLKEILESNTTDRLHFLAYTSKSKKLIGYSFITEINFEKGSAELVVIADKKYIGIGYGSLINLAMIEYCFFELNLSKVYCEIRIDNKNIPDRVEGEIVRSVPVSGSKGVKYRDYYYREWLKKDWVKNKKIADLKSSIKNMN